MARVSPYLQEIFYKSWCGQSKNPQDSAASFYNWCAQLTLKGSESRTTTRCDHVFGSGEHADCKTEIVWQPNGMQMGFRQMCDLGGPNHQLDEGWRYSKLSPEGLAEIIDHCKWYNKSVWPIILIGILGAIAILAVASFLFYRYYLRRRFYPTSKEKREDEMLKSRFTSQFSTSDTSSIGAGSGLRSLYTVDAPGRSRHRKQSAHSPRPASRSNSRSSTRAASSAAPISVASSGAAAPQSTRSASLMPVSSSGPAPYVTKATKAGSTNPSQPNLFGPSSASLAHGSGSGSAKNKINTLR